jgi:CRISPR/Cas system-associated exonuclease Cas4 (RecB family)
MEEWPTSIYYLVAPGYGNPQMFKVDRDLKREAELHLRIATIKDCYDNETFPKVRGWNCERCQYFKPCWNVAGWEEEFEAKRKVAVSEDK